METQAGYEPDHLFTNGRSLRYGGRGPKEAMTSSSSSSSNNTTTTITTQ